MCANTWKATKQKCNNFFFCQTNQNYRKAPQKKRTPSSQQRVKQTQRKSFTIPHTYSPLWQSLEREREIYIHPHSLTHTILIKPGRWGNNLSNDHLSIKLPIFLLLISCSHPLSPFKSWKNNSKTCAHTFIYVFYIICCSYIFYTPLRYFEY